MSGSARAASIRLSIDRLSSPSTVLRLDTGRRPLTPNLCTSPAYPNQQISPNQCAQHGSHGVHGRCQLVQFPSVHISRFWSSGFFISRLIGSNPCFSIRLSCESEQGLMRAVEANDLNVEIRPIWIGKDFITGHKINMAF